MELSEHLKKLRLDNGFSQEELSEKSGLGLRTIQRLENGESSPRDDTLRLLTKALNVPQDYFKKNKNTYMEKTMKRGFQVPWLIVSLTIIGSSLGVILGFILVLSNKPLLNDAVSLIIIITIAVLFMGIGLLIGSFLEKKFKKK
ncbi:helix-turn-helix domain-containing protein [Salinimicrobium xinjiangense]|uniref:helix-turn-helix domain-containing protein n=1 Tax=Salinimicrobium xinjiangense TaxID=438596 RepID=UPI000684906B|nr:helix-turn-helix domain-containing protein [Salinimicrobium xinjiangense]